MVEWVWEWQVSNRDGKQDLSEMRKIDPRSGIYIDMQSIRLNKVWLPHHDASNWYSRLIYYIGSGVDLGFMHRSQHWCNWGHQHSRDWLSELNLGLPCPTRLVSVQWTLYFILFFTFSLHSYLITSSYLI
jgi:hypothetical protein